MMPTCVFLLADQEVELLKNIDYAVIIVYLLGIVVMGCLFARGQKTTDDYFLASRRMHWFPLALSIWASLTSANSMLGAPAYSYSQDLQPVPMAALLGLLSAVFVIYLILPLLQRLQLTTAYTYLEMRYNLPARLLGSFLFILLRGGWLATVIYGPSLALSAVIPLPSIDAALQPVADLCGTDHGSTIFWIVIVGLGATLYTVVGGLKAVIWTDVIQFFVFAGGIVVIWFVLLTEIPGGAKRLFNDLGNVPRAHAGFNQEVAWGDKVTLDGSASRSFDGSELAFSWRQTGTSVVELDNDDQPGASFNAPSTSDDGKPIELKFTLRVTTIGPNLQSAASVVSIKVVDNPEPSQGAAAPPLFHERRHDTMFDFRWGLFFGTGVTFWLIFFSSIVGRINDAGTDQVALQRYFSATSMSESRRAIWFNAICDLPLMPLLYLTGAGVLMYYAIHHNPDLPAAPGKAMPYFVAHRLNEVVPGLSGLFIAALFAATMSSVDSGINSISAALVTDWYRRLLVPDSDERHYLRTARCLTLVLGVLATVVALFLGQIGEIWQVATAAMGLWAGPLLGMFLLGFFSTRTNSIGVLIGAVVGLACTIAFKQAGGNEFFYAIAGLFPTLIVGYVASCFGPRPKPQQIDGLTTWTRNRALLIAANDECRRSTRSPGRKKSE